MFMSLQCLEPGALSTQAVPEKGWEAEGEAAAEEEAIRNPGKHCY